MTRTEELRYETGNTFIALDLDPFYRASCRKSSNSRVEFSCSLLDGDSNGEKGQSDMV